MDVPKGPKSMLIIDSHEKICSRHYKNSAKDILSKSVTRQVLVA